MRDERGSSDRRRPGQPGGRREEPYRPPARPSGPEPPLDVERAKTEIERFLELAAREMNLDIEREITVSGSGDTGDQRTEIAVKFRGADEELLLAQNAELLLAFEHLAHRWLRLDPRLHDRVRFDCADYRATHLEELKLSARVAAQRVRETGQEFEFNPMSSRERRIIHLELSAASGVRTVSEGVGDRRRLVIYPVNKPLKK
jgi:spoIIIJ-associated protein